MSGTKTAGDVLIVHPTSDTVFVLECLFRWNGWGTHKVHDPAHAKDILEAEDLAVVVIEMCPDKSGLELVKEVRTNPRTQHIGVVVTDAHPNEGNEVLALQAGADAFVPAPFKHISNTLSAAERVAYLRRRAA